jgi:hypothetical protein
MICEATTPPDAPPNVKPQNMLVTNSERCFSGPNSDVIVMAVGMAPPRARPVRNRNQLVAGFLKRLNLPASRIGTGFGGLRGRIG